MRTALSVALAAFLLAGSSSATAAEPAAADQLARLLMPKATWSQGIDQLSQALQGRMRAHPGTQLQYPADFADKARKEVEQVLPYEELVGMHAKELAAAYSPAELDGLIAFYKGPLGQKAVQTMPNVSQKVAMATQQRVESKMGDVMKRLASHAKAPAGAASQGGAALPAGHPPMGGAAPAAKKAAPAAKGATAKPKAKADTAPKATAGAATPKATEIAPAAPKADAAAK